MAGVSYDDEQTLKEPGREGQTVVAVLMGKMYGRTVRQGRAWKASNSAPMEL